MRHSKPVRLQTAPAGERKCLFTFRIHHKIGVAEQRAVIFFDLSCRNQIRHTCRPAGALLVH